MAADTRYPELKPGLVVCFWLLIVTIGAARSLFGASSTPLFADTDDAMRLVVVRDFLAGQNWYDLVQHRLNTPYGAELHWSRLVDLPIAAILGGLELVLAPAHAEAVVGYVWPSLLLLALLWLSARLALDLAGPDAILPALVLPALAPAVMQQFVPGRLDHHGVQIILAVIIVLCSVRTVVSPRWAIGAGVASATALAIGTEALPVIAAATLGLGLLWVFRPERNGALRGFGVSFALSTVVHAAIALPPDRWLVPACDALSPVYVVAAVAVGVGFALLSLLPVRGAVPAVRLAWGLLAGAVAIGVVIALYPACLHGPYAAVDAWLVDNWLGRILEARPVWESLRDLPADTLAIIVPPIVGLGAAAWMAKGTKGDRRAAWLLAGFALAVAIAATALQVRGARFAGILAIPPAAAFIAAARTRYLATRKPVAIAGLVGSWVVSAGVAVLAICSGLLFLASYPPRQSGVAEQQTGNADGKEACLLRSAFADLRGLPPERIMTPIDLGAHMLMETPHAVVAAPYHRNQQGVRDAFRFFNEPLEDQRSMLAERGIGLIVTCPAMAEMQGGPGTDPASFVALSATGALPGWLVDQSLPGAPLRVYAVLPLEP